MCFARTWQGRFVDGNQRFCDTLGKPLARDRRQDATPISFPREQCQKYRRDDMHVMETGEALEDIEAYIKPTGEKLHVQVLKAPVRDAEGQIVGVQGMFWDVTERIRADEAARKSDARFRKLVQSSLIGVIVAASRRPHPRRQRRVPAAWSATRATTWLRAACGGTSSRLPIIAQATCRRSSSCRPPARASRGRRNTPQGRPPRAGADRRDDAGARRQRVHLLRRRYHAAEADRAGAEGRQGSGRRRQPGQEPVPGQHEPRSPHADERDHRHHRAGAEYAAGAQAGRVPADGDAVGRVAAGA